MVWQGKLVTEFRDEDACECVCVCVCVCVCMYVCMYACVYVCMYFFKLFIACSITKSNTTCLIKIFTNTDTIHVQCLEIATNYYKLLS
jgi:hypothetical protein